jgi:hypothetical protein
VRFIGANILGNFEVNLSLVSVEAIDRLAAAL